MATTKAEEKRARDYYHKNRAYRLKKIKKTADEHKQHKKEYNKKMRDYYHSNTNYRKYKIAYAKRYNKGRKGK